VGNWWSRNAIFPFPFPRKSKNQHVSIIILADFVALPTVNATAVVIQISDAPVLWQINLSVPER